MLYREIIAVCSQIHTKHINTLCGQSVELLTSKKSVKNILKMPERMFVLSISSPLPACIVNNQQINTVSGLGQGSVPGSVPLPEIYISRNLPPPPSHLFITSRPLFVRCYSVTVCKLLFVSVFCIERTK